MPTVMNPGAPLVLNLQPGQTMQPLTLIQSPSLGQLIRPGVGMSTVLSQKQPAPGPSHPGSTFTNMQLPTTLTIRTSAPGSVNLQVSQVSGGSSQKLASSPDQNSASTNGVMKATNLSTTKGWTIFNEFSILSRMFGNNFHVSPGPTASGQTLSVVTTATASEPPRVVMSVEEFYYGRFSGDISLRKPPPPGMNIFSFTCYICSFRAENNLRSDLQTWFCGRHKRELTCVNLSVLLPGLCRICEWAFDNEPAFLNHMKSNHKPGEMPYVCQVGVPVENHRSFRRPPQLEGLPPGSKVSPAPQTSPAHFIYPLLLYLMMSQLFTAVPQAESALFAHHAVCLQVTIRTYGKLKPQMAPNSIFQPNRIKTEHPKFPIQKNPTLIKAPKSPTKRGLGRRGHSSPFVSCRLSSGDQLVCLECGTDASDLTAHYPTYVHCLLCPYSSCCSRAYAAHMIQ
ncbi:hypothetical protein GOODEAATRI_018776 [Goodea atripinnis]|uniref:C2H2-type domain-containing protein n=1 Tax=Goodea atripinnis TaxID=208336 RepID=A0ABV0MIZ4_9TELE